MSRTRRALVFVFVAVAGCGGGGGGDGGNNAPASGLVVTPTTLIFNASQPLVSRPPSQPIHGTVNGFPGGTLFVRVAVSGTAVSSVDSFVITAPNGGRLTVHPAEPATLGPGMHTSTITVIACTTDVNCSGPQLPGSPQTVQVTYQIGQPVVPAAVFPEVGPANTAGEVILRGEELHRATGVTFGGVAATSFTIVGSNEIRATYPNTLGAGTHGLQILNPAGNIGFGGSLILVAPTTYAADTILYPVGAQRVRGFAYDAVRRSLYVGLAFPDSATNRVVRYAFISGSWTLTDTATVPDLRDIAQAPWLNGGGRILAISDTSLAQLDGLDLSTALPIATPPISTSTPAGQYLKAIVVANDGNAIVLGGSPNFGQLYRYRILENQFSVGTGNFFHPVAGGPANGSFVLFMDSGLTTPSAAYRYSASTGTIATTNFNIQHHHPVAGREENINSPVFDRHGARFIVAGFSGGEDYGVYNATSFARLGTLPVTTAAYALAPNGLRAYTLDLATGCRVRAFDVSGPPLGNGQLPEFTAGGYPIALGAPCPASTAATQTRMVLTPGGDTAFIAGNANIVVVPLP